ncbi:MAG: HPr family phosphocarrier protein [Clostridiales bacterium]|nr:HPr family phosphocarrier protein [Clostridiales bacterium]
MKQFVYTIDDPVGIHALLVKAIKALDSTVTIEGGDEDIHAANLEKFFKDNL